MSSYQHYNDWKHWSKETFGVWTNTDAAYYKAELKRAGINSCLRRRIYEVGFGNGPFAGYVRALGAEYYGSELNDVLVLRAKELKFDVFDGGIKEALNAIGSNSFDLVVAFDVLEHLSIEDIAIFLGDSLKLLKPGGKLIARIPSGDSPFGRAIFHGDITHRTALGSSAVRQLAAAVGFDVVEIGSPRLPVFGLGPLRAIRRSCVTLAQSIVGKLINLIFHDGQPRVITANLFFILKKPVHGF